MFSSILHISYLTMKREREHGSNGFGNDKINVKS